ncbi:MAG TPA: hypothetical protein DCQ99_01200 [Nitrospinae bacterium]|nr:hypothetical protein [Nitrospinota bacterium]HBA26131.1 hypothetical protein [Nitrospinota bacterium]
MDLKEKGRVWLSLGIYTLLMLVTRPIMPLLLKIYYENLSFPLSSVCYIISIVIFFTIIGYLAFVRKECRASVYVWLFVLSSVYALLIFRQKLPAEKFHFFEYGLFSYFSHNAVKENDIIARLLKFKNSYVIAFIFILVISLIDEFIQYFLPNRVGDLRDVFLNIISGVLGLMVIGLVLRRQEG